MSWTKNQIIEQALAEIGIASYIFDTTAEERANSLRILDSMMAEWTTRGIVFDPVYPATVNPGGGDIDAETNAPNDAVGPMYNNLALRLAPGFGKTPSNQTKLDAKAGYSLLAQSITVPCVRRVGMIRGAGAKTPIRPFIGEDTVTAP